MALALALYAIGGMFLFYAIEVPYERQVGRSEDWFVTTGAHNIRAERPQ